MHHATNPTKRSVKKIVNEPDLLSQLLPLGGHFHCSNFDSHILIGEGSFTIPFARVVIACARVFV